MLRTNFTPKSGSIDLSGDIGVRVYATSGQKPMRKFYYAANTTRYRKGVCFFGVEIVPDQNGMRVSSFGPLMLQSGKLPDCLR